MLSFSSIGFAAALPLARGDGEGDRPQPWTWPPSLTSIDAAGNGTRGRLFGLSWEVSGRNRAQHDFCLARRVSLNAVDVTPQNETFNDHPPRATAAAFQQVPCPPPPFFLLSVAPQSCSRPRDASDSRVLLPLLASLVNPRKSNSSKRLARPIREKTWPHS